MSQHTRLERLADAENDTIERLRFLANQTYLTKYPDDETARLGLKEFCENQYGQVILRQLLSSQQKRDELQTSLRQAYSACVEATVASDGCTDGKKEFLEEVGVPEDYWPEVTVDVTYTVPVTITWLHENVDVDDSDLIERATELASEVMSYDYAEPTITEAYR